MMNRENLKSLIRFLKQCGSSFTAAEHMKKEFVEKGFVELDYRKAWNLQRGKAYVLRYEGALVAFRLGADLSKGFSIIGSHTDSPGFQVKGMELLVKDEDVRLNTEVYGGPILNTWFDRPLSLSGRVFLCEQGQIREQIVHFKEPLALFPNLAIHMNREVNKGYEINPQKELPLLLTEDRSLRALLARKLQVEEQDILDGDLFLYDIQGPVLMGEKEEYLQSPRLDNLAMAYASMLAMLTASVEKNSMIIAWDHEEIGSSTQSGADSMLLREILERILSSEELHSREAFALLCSNSFLISADMAHGHHPNHEEVGDPLYRPKMGQGPVIKHSARKSYTTTAGSSAFFKSLCDKAKVPCQVFYNASNRRGGGTISPITASHLMIPSVDVGAPMLAMHSCRELMHGDDFLSMEKVFESFFQ